jgi:hypothetical protein
VPEEKLDSRMGTMLEERLGYYIHNILWHHYDALRQKADYNSRYAVRAPITDFARDVWPSCKTNIEEEADELAECIIRGVQRRSTSDGSDSDNYMPREFEGSSYILPSELRRLIKLLDVNGSYKEYKEALIRAGVLSHKDDHRTSTMRLGFKLLKPGEEYWDFRPKMV